MHSRITWLHSTSCQRSETEQIVKTGLIENFMSTAEDCEKASFNIVMSSKKLAHSILEPFSKLENAFQNLNINFGWIDSVMDCYNDSTFPDGKTIVIGEDNYISKWLVVPDVKTVHLSAIGRNDELHIGFQRHFKAHNNPYSVSLGELRADMSNSETAIRCAERLHFHIDALRKEDSHSPHSFVSGLDIYQMSRLMRLAGLSKRLSLMCINTVDELISPVTAQSISLLVWYLSLIHI